MRFARSLLAVTPFLLLAAAAPANAAVSHTVQPGETLWSIAAANNLTTRTVAAYNGLSETAQVVLGSTINVPTTVEGAAALQAAGVQLDGVAPQAAAPAAPPPPRRRRARPPCSAPTWSAPATRSRASPPTPASRLSQMAGRQRPRPVGPAADRHRAQAALRRAHAGARLRAAADPARRPRGRRPRRRRRASAPPTSSPWPRSTASRPRSPPRSRGRRAGFNNGMVSSANARGVMQVMPGTWDYVEQQPRRAQARHRLGDRQRPRRRALPQAPARGDGRRREHRDRRLLPGPRRRPLARAVRRHAEVRRERPGAALALRGLQGSAGQAHAAAATFCRRGARRAGASARRSRRGSARCRTPASRRSPRACRRRSAGRPPRRPPGPCR